MLKSIALSVSLLLVASPLQAQSNTDATLINLYGQLGYDVGYHYCIGIKSGSFSPDNYEEMSSFLNGRLTQNEIMLAMSVFDMDENDFHREVFFFQMYRALKHGGCEDSTR